jgi:hypothetical protein
MNVPISDALLLLHRFFKSMHHIRKKHCIASRRCNKAGLPRISQLDMALTQFGFVGYSLLSSDKLGIVGTEKDFDGLVHFWRVVGHLLGMEDRQVLYLVKSLLLLGCDFHSVI